MSASADSKPGAAGAESPADRRTALAHRAWNHRSAGRFAEAIDDYDACLALDRELGVDDPELRRLKATTLCDASRFDEAAKAALELLVRDPLDAAAFEALRRGRVGLGAVEPARPAKAVLEAEAADAAPGRRVFFNPVVERLNAETAGFPTSIFPDVGRLIYALVRALRPKLLLETGSFIGYSALCIAQALEDNGEGHVHCFDLFGEPPFEYASPVAGKLPTLREIAQAHLGLAGLSHRAELHPGDSSSAIAAAFPEEKPVLDFAFIDGDHLVKGCLKDWRAVDVRLKEGGVVVLHDTNARGSGWYGPEHLLEQLDARERENYRWVELPTLDNLGLGLVRKMKPGTARAWRPGVAELVAERLFMRANWKK